MQNKPGFVKQVGRKIGEFFLKDELAALSNMQYLFKEAYQWGPGVVTPDQAQAMLQEYVYDPELFSVLSDQFANWDVISGNDEGSSEQLRLRLVKRARSEYLSNTIVGRTVDLWTDFGFGINIDITAREDVARDVLDEFWVNPRNQATLGQRKIKELSNTLLNNGEIFFVFFISKLDGVVTIRTIPTDEITKAVTVGTDNNIVGYWKREFISMNSKDQVGIGKKTVYYRDWLAEANGVVDSNGEIEQDPLTDKPMILLPEGAVIADQRIDDTDVIILPITMIVNKMGRGMPLMTSGLAWAGVYDGFAKDRAAIAKIVAMSVDKITAKNTGQRGLDNLRAKISTTLANPGSGFGSERNPAPARGSMWLQNDQVDRERMPLGTGAGDAQKDNSILLNMVGLSAGVFPHYLGAGEAFRLATATAMEVPMLRMFQRYQSFWVSVWEDIARIVFEAYNRYKKTGEEIKDETVDVNQDAIIDFEVEDVIAVMDEIQDMISNQLLTVEAGQKVLAQLTRIALQSVGVKNTSDLLDDEDFETDLIVDDENIEDDDPGVEEVLLELLAKRQADRKK